MSKIVADNLRKEYGETVALDDVSFEVPASEFVGTSKETSSSATVSPYSLRRLSATILLI